MPDTDVRVLIVDDEPALLKMIGVYLTRVGFGVTAFASSDLAWAAVKDNCDFTIAVVDATLRGLSAQELALRLLAANAKIRVLMASGYPMDMTVLDAAGAGRVSFMQKPFTSQQLAQTVRKLLGPEEAI